MPDTTKIPPLVEYLIATVTAVVALLASQGLIENRTEKLIAGLAAIVLPAAYMLAAALWNLAHARVTAARILAGQPTSLRTQ